MQLKRTTKEIMIAKIDAHSNAVEEAAEEGAIVVEAVKEAEVQEKTKPIRKEIVANNTMDSIFGKSVQQTGTVLPTKQEEEKTVVERTSTPVLVVGQTSVRI